MPNKLPTLKSKLLIKLSCDWLLIIERRLFATLAADQSHSLPYNKDIADQRRKYGEGVLRRCDEHVASQRQYEGDMHAKVEAARQKRQAEKEKQEALEVRSVILSFLMFLVFISRILF